MACPAILTYNDALFRAQFPAFADPTAFPQAVLQMYWDQATSYVSDVNYGWLAGVNRQLALNLMTAHLVAISQLIAAGETPSVVTGASIDKVSVSLLPPPLKNQWQYWLSTTPYGQQLLALLQVNSAGGFYQPGSLGRAGFTFARPFLCR